MAQKYDTRRFRDYRSYKIRDICWAYEDRNLHKQTVRKWIKKEGLKAFEYGGVFYIYGAVLKDFLLSPIHT